MAEVNNYEPSWKKTMKGFYGSNEPEMQAPEMPTNFTELKAAAGENPENDYAQQYQNYTRGKDAFEQQNREVLQQQHEALKKNYAETPEYDQYVGEMYANGEKRKQYGMQMASADDAKDAQRVNTPVQAKPMKAAVPERPQNEKRQLMSIDAQGKATGTGKYVTRNASGNWQDEQGNEYHVGEQSAQQAAAYYAENIPNKQEILEAIGNGDNDKAQDMVMDSLFNKMGGENLTYSKNNEKTFGDVYNLLIQEKLEGTENSILETMEDRLAEAQQKQKEILAATPDNDRPLRGRPEVDLSSILHTGRVRQNEEAEKAKATHKDVVDGMVADYTAQLKKMGYDDDFIQKAVPYFRGKAEVMLANRTSNKVLAESVSSKPFVQNIVKATLDIAGGFNDSLVGKILNHDVNQYDGYINNITKLIDQNNMQGDLWIPALRGGFSFLVDMPFLFNPISRGASMIAGGLWDKGLLRYGGKLVDALVGKGWSREAAERIFLTASQQSTKNMFWKSLVVGSASGGMTFGTADAISGFYDYMSKPTLPEDMESQARMTLATLYDYQVDPSSISTEDVALFGKSMGERLYGASGNAIERGKWGSFSGIFFVGNPFGEMIGRGRGIGRRLLGDAVKLGINASGMSVAQSIETGNWSDYDKTLLQNVINLGVFDAAGIISRARNYKAIREQERRMETPDEMKEIMRANGIPEAEDFVKALASGELKLPQPEQGRLRKGMKVQLFERKKNDDGTLTEPTPEQKALEDQINGYLQNTSIPEVMRAQMYMVLTGNAWKLTNPSSVGEVRKAGDKLAVDLLDIDGNVIDTHYYSSVEKAENGRKELNEQITISDMDDIVNSYASRMAQYTFTPMLTEEYNDGLKSKKTRYDAAVEKMNRVGKKGLTKKERRLVEKGLSDHEQDVIMVMENQDVYQSARDKLSRGEMLDESETSVLQASNRLYAEHFEKNKDMSQFIEEFEKDNEMEAGEFERIRKGHATKKEAEESMADEEDTVIKMGDRYYTKSEMQVLRDFRDEISKAISEDDKVRQRMADAAVLQMADDISSSSAAVPTEQREVHTSMAAAHEEGKALGGEERINAEADYENKRDELAKALGVSADALDEHLGLKGDKKMSPAEVSMRYEGNAMVKDYLHARERHNGVWYTMQQKAKAAAEEATAVAQKITGRDKTVTMIELKDKKSPFDPTGEIVYLKKGNVVRNADGSIDYGRTEAHIIVCDAEGNPRSIAKENIQRVGVEMSAEEFVKSERDNAVTSAVAQEMAELNEATAMRRQQMVEAKKTEKPTEAKTEAVETPAETPKEKPEPKVEEKPVEQQEGEPITDNEGNIIPEKNRPSEVYDYYHSKGMDELMHDELARAQKELADAQAIEVTGNSTKEREQAYAEKNARIKAVQDKIDFWNKVLGESDRRANTLNDAAARVENGGKAEEAKQIDTNNITDAEIAEHNQRVDKQGGLVLDAVSLAQGGETCTMLDAIGKALNIRISFNPYVDGGANGEWRKTKDGIQTIEINPNRISNSNPLSFILGHELTHSLRSTTEGLKVWNTLLEAVKADLGDELFNAQFAERKATYDDFIDAENERRKANGEDLLAKLTDDDIKEEIVADYVGNKIFKDKAYVEDLLKRVEESGASSKDIIDRVREYIDKVLSALKSIVNPTFTQRQQIDAFEEAKRIWGDMYEYAAAKEREAAKAEEIATNALATTMEDGTSKPVQTKLSVSSNIEGAGFVASVKNENGEKVPLTDEEGNFAIRMGDKIFTGKNKVKVSDIKDNKNSILNYIIEDALHFGTITEKKADNIYAKYCDLINTYLDLGLSKNGGVRNVTDKWQWLGDTVFRSVAKNSDPQYLRSIDITRICKKNEAVINAISELQSRQRYGATPAQILDLYEQTIVEGYQAPCPVCYVFTRYIRNGKYASAAINGMRKYGKHLKGQAEEWTVKDWENELARLEAEKEKYKAEISRANDIVTRIPDEIDKLAKKITNPNTPEAEKKALREQVEELDVQYRQALDVVSQQSLTNWIKSFAIQSDKGKTKIRKDAVMPKDMNDFENHALDLRLTSSAMIHYPGIQRLRRSGGSAGGKEITQASNNELGEVIQGLGTGDPEKSTNWYQKAVEASTPKQRAKARSNARKGFANAMLYAKRQTLRGGQRQWSWSDNIERLSNDVAVNLMQMEMLGGAVQTYSKQLEGVNMVASMGAYVNGSLMGKGLGYREVRADEIRDIDGMKVLNDGGFKTVDKNGKEVTLYTQVYEDNGKYYVLDFDDVIGIDPFGKKADGKNLKGLFDLNQKLDKAGNILVGMNDIHIRAAMNDNRIYFIIPWHASGANQHILAQMYEFLGTKLNTKEATDYTNMQEEKDMMKVTDGKMPEVPSRLTQIWEDSKNEYDFACGIRGGVDSSAEGKVSESQMHYRELRDAILIGIPNEYTGANGKTKVTYNHVSSNKKWMKEIEADEFLRQVYRKVNEMVGEEGMTKDDRNHIYPYEYWDENSTIDTADINGERYLEYCRRLGFKPKFCGDFKAKEGSVEADRGNFINDRGYWKTLIDRRMYDTDGKFQDLTAIDSSEFTTDLINPDVTKENFDVTKVADEQGTSRIVEGSIQKEMKRHGGNLPNVDYTLDMANAAERMAGKSKQTTQGLSYEETLEASPSIQKAKADGKIEPDAVVRKFSVSSELDEKYPDWRNQQKKNGGHTTQISGTKPTYVKIGEFLRSTGDGEKTILDASSGKGYGTQALRDMGFNVEDVEPFQENSRLNSEDGMIPADYDSYESLQGKQYDVVISNAVLNVIPDDYRETNIKQIADATKVGGKLFINVRGKSEVLKVKKGIQLDDPYELLIPQGKNEEGKPTYSYQKFWTKEEFRDYMQEKLGEGWDVEIARTKNIGFSPSSPIVVCYKKYESTSPEGGERKFSLSSEELGQYAEEYEERNGEPLPGNITLNKDGNGAVRSVTVTWASGKKDKQERNKATGVGKKVGDEVYFHKNYAEDVVPSDVLERTKAALPSDFAYNTMVYNKKSGYVRFDEAPDFDTAREPKPGDMIIVDANTGKIIPDSKGNTIRHSDFIWHHKWEWVKDDYEGFDVQESFDWTTKWKSAFDAQPKGIGSMRVWNEALASVGLPADGEAKIKYSITGERGANDAEKQDLEIAKEMKDAGKDAKTIKIATGWEVGADGKWKLEKSDFPEPNREVKPRTLGEAYPEGHELFAAYPQLKEIKLDYSKRISLAGSYNSDSKTIKVSKEIWDTEGCSMRYLRKTIQHEVQHAIQRIEGFAKGGSPSYINYGEVFKQHPEESALHSVFGQDNSWALLAKQRASNLKGLVNRWLASDKPEQYPEQAKRMRILSDFFEDASQADYLDLVKRAKSVFSKAKRAATDRYNHLAGEVESDNTEARLDWSDEQRRNTLLEDTERVPRKKQIVEFEENGESKLKYSLGAPYAGSENKPFSEYKGGEVAREEVKYSRVQSKVRKGGYYDTVTENQAKLLDETYTTYNDKEKYTQAEKVANGVREQYENKWNNYTDNDRPTKEQHNKERVKAMDKAVMDMFDNNEWKPVIYVPTHLPEVAEWLKKHGWNGEDSLAYATEAGYISHHVVHHPNAFTADLDLNGYDMQENANNPYIIGYTENQPNSLVIIRNPRDDEWYSTVITVGDHTYIGDGKMQWQTDFGKKKNPYKKLIPVWDSKSGESRARAYASGGSLILNAKLQQKSDATKETTKKITNVNNSINKKSLTPAQDYQVHSDNFKKWFGDWENDPENASKVVDEEGKPMIVYHGTKWNPYAEKEGEAVFKAGWFTGIKERAEGYGEPIAAYLNLRNPIIRYDIKDANNSTPLPDGFDFYDKSTWGDHDGVITYKDYPDDPKLSKGQQMVIRMKNPENPEQAIADYLAKQPRGRQIFSVLPRYPEQIKSSTDNNGDFDGSNPDIRYSLPIGGRMRQRKNETPQDFITRQQNYVNLVVSSPEEARQRVTDEIRSMLDDKRMGSLSKQTLNQMIKEVRDADEDNLQEVIKQVHRTMNTLSDKSLNRQIDKLTNMKIQGRNGRNMSVAKNVDDATRKAFEFLKGRLIEFKATDFDDEKHTLNSELFAVRQENRNLEMAHSMATDAAEQQALEKQIDDNNQRIEEIKAKLKDLDTEIQNARTANHPIQQQTVIDLITDLSKKYNEHLLNGGEWTDDDVARQTALFVLNKRLRLDDLTSEMEKQKIDMDLKRIQLSEAIKRGDKQDADNIKRDIAICQDMQDDILQQQVALKQEIVDDMSSMITEGKESLKDKVQREQQRKSDLILGFWGDIAGNKPQKRLSQKEMDDNAKKRNGLQRGLRGVVGSFEYMAQHMSETSLGKDSWFYRYFMQSENGVMAAHNTFWEGVRETTKQMNDKAEEIFGEKYMDVMKDNEKVENGTGIYITITDHGMDVDVEQPMSKGQATYLYMVWKMPDGRAKLEKQGFTEESIAQAREFIGDDNAAWADWVQGEFLPSLREKYNKKYAEMYNTSMAQIENYVPLKIDSNTRHQEIDVAEMMGQQTLNQKAGSLINRTHNLNPVDLTRSAYDIIAEHVKDMEEWYAFARVRQDLNYILSSTAIRNTMNANEKASHERLIKAAKIATGTYKTDTSDASALVNSITKGLAGANIAFRNTTALKQMLSMPAFLGYSQDPRFIASLLTNTGIQYGRHIPTFLATMGTMGWAGKHAMDSAAGMGSTDAMSKVALSQTMRWCIDNIPSFRHRVSKGGVGNVIIDELLSDDTTKFDRFKARLGQYGMAANGLVDAVTCSIGIKTIYDYKFARLKEAADKDLKDGIITQEEHDTRLVEADRIAKNDADIYYNGTQQSNHPAFLAPAQMDRDVASKMFTLYKNSPLSYARKAILSYYDLKKLRNWNKLAERQANQYMKEEGLDYDSAKAKAKKHLWGSLASSSVGVAVYGYLMNWLWNLGGKGLLGFLQDEDDGEDKTTVQETAEALSPLLVGIPIVDIAISTAAGQDVEPLLMYDVQERFATIMQKYNNGKDVSQELAFELLNLAARVGVGIDLNTLGNVYLGVEHLIKTGGITSENRTKMIDLMLLLNTPNSNRKQVARKVYSEFTPEEFDEAILRAEKALTEIQAQDDWHRYLPGYKILDEGQHNKIRKEYAEMNATDNQKAFAERRKADTKEEINKAYPDVRILEEDYDKEEDPIRKAHMREVIIDRIKKNKEGVKSEDELYEKARKEMYEEKPSDMKYGTDVYLWMSNSDDVREDEALKENKKAAEPYYKKWVSLGKNFNKEGKEYYESHKEIIDTYRKLDTFGRTLSRMKKDLNKAPEAEKEKRMEAIRKVRKTFL